PLPTAATNLKPRTKAYKKLHREQLQRQQVKELERIKARNQRRHERAYTTGAKITERDYYGGHESKGGVIHLMEKKKKGVNERREYIEKMKKKWGTKEASECALEAGMKPIGFLCL
ncbi:MAG: hypothetical protein Q9226_009197, partial [Calogaya cf. arnoldii]